MASFLYVHISHFVQLTSTFCVNQICFQYLIPKTHTISSPFCFTQYDQLPKSIIRNSKYSSTLHNNTSSLYHLIDLPLKMYVFYPLGLSFISSCYSEIPLYFFVIGSIIHTLSLTPTHLSIIPFSPLQPHPLTIARNLLHPTTLSHSSLL